MDKTIKIPNEYAELLMKHYKYIRKCIYLSPTKIAKKISLLILRLENIRTIDERMELYMKISFLTGLLLLKIKKYDSGRFVIQYKKKKYGQY